jgi:hypothetical protein
MIGMARCGLTAVKSPECSDSTPAEDEGRRSRRDYDVGGL